jgi:hypothetical protein
VTAITQKSAGSCNLEPRLSEKDPSIIRVVEIWDRAVETAGDAEWVGHRLGQHWCLTRLHTERASAFVVN